jgi:serine/threonine protein kinase
VVHRDIKPENLLFDEFGNVRIADFGIAITKNGTRMTKEHQIVGSAQYMSPEQARSSKVDNETDIYSLGIVIYERLTGSVPFDSDESISILVSHVSAKPKKLPPKMRHWQKLIDKCLAKNPKNRFRSMLELKEALGKVPTNTIQRTNSSITTVLESNNGKHLKWFVPVILLMVVFATIYSTFNKPNLEDSPKNSETPDIAIVSMPIETIIEEPKQTQAITVKDTVDQENSADTEIQTKLLANETKQQQIQVLLEKANQNIKEYRLSNPKSNTAIDQLLAVLKIEPKNPDAVLGMQNIGETYFQ